MTRIELRGFLRTHTPSSGRSSCSLREQVEAVLDGLRPAMEADGGGVEVAEVSEGVVLVRLTGTCLDCPSASLTLHQGLEPALRRRLPWVRAVRRIA